MACPSDEQLVAAALALADDSAVMSHVTQCAACSQTIAKLRDVNNQLSTLHAAVNQASTAGRDRLIAAVASEPKPSRSASGFVAWFARLSQGQRIAAGSFGLSTAIVLLLLFLAFANSAGRLSAMERLVKQLREVTSFSYDLEEVTIRESGKHWRKLLRNDKTYWQSPASLRATLHMVTWPDPRPASDAPSDLLTDIVEIYQPGHRGILIDYKTKTYLRTPELRADEDFGSTSPVTWLQRIQQGNVKVISDLGAKTMDGKEAHGYMVTLDDPKRNSEPRNVEVWIDPKTNFPLMYRYQESGDQGTSDAWSDTMTVKNCQWNIQLDPQLFDTTPPEGFEDVTPPEDESTFAEISSALKLYAELSGGHYPNVKKFDGDEVRDEMRRLAGFNGSPRPEWNDEARYQQIENAMPGLREITRVLGNHVARAGYQGATVGPDDKNKVLLWWTTSRPHEFRVFFGDLRTEVVPLKEWQKIAPEDIRSTFSDEAE